MSQDNQQPDFDNTYAEPSSAPQNVNPISGNPEQEARNWAMICHLATLAWPVIPFGHVVGPLIVWLIKKDQYPLVEVHGREVINFQISLTIYFISAVILTVSLVFACIGIPILAVIGIFGLVCTIIACVKAYHGESFRYPLSIRFIK